MIKPLSNAVGAEGITDSPVLRGLYHPRWCNGSTKVSETFSFGSNPDRGASRVAPFWVRLMARPWSLEPIIGVRISDPERKNEGHRC